MKITDEELTTMALEASSMKRETWNRLMETMKTDAEMNKVMKADWKTRNRETEGSIRDYYRHSDIWFVNTFCHGKGALMKLADPDWTAAASELQTWHREFMAFYPGNVGGQRILDYGGGLWNDSWPLILSGFKVTQAEIRGGVTNLLKTFIDRAGLQHHASVLAVDSDMPVHDQYDGILCFETLEHVLKPVELTQHLVNHLRSGGVFAMSTSFGAPEHAPYHVASNAYLSDRKVWCDKLESMGLKKVWVAADEHRHIWRKD